mmetsp:Transcript_8493/g.33700  ORF Transcript_8493/g.33700 Transcript_8493/m.33700 type:complete len:265 (-) Transcript_8493:189-983(-)
MYDVMRIGRSPTASHRSSVSKSSQSCAYPSAPATKLSMSPKSPTVVIPLLSKYSNARLNASSRSLRDRFGTAFDIAAVANSFRIPVGAPSSSNSTIPPAITVFAPVIFAISNAASLANPTCPHVRVTHTFAPTNRSSPRVHAFDGVSPPHDVSSQPCPSTHFSFPASIARARVSMNSSLDRTPRRSSASSANPPVTTCACASTKPLRSARPPQSNTTPNLVDGTSSTAMIRPCRDTVMSLIAPASPTAQFANVVTSASRSASVE